MLSLWHEENTFCQGVRGEHFANTMLPVWMLNKTFATIDLILETSNNQLKGASTCSTQSKHFETTIHLSFLSRLFFPPLKSRRENTFLSPSSLNPFTQSPRIEKSRLSLPHGTGVAVSLRQMHQGVPSRDPAAVDRCKKISAGEALRTFWLDQHLLSQFP